MGTRADKVLQKIHKTESYRQIPYVRYGSHEQADAQGIQIKSGRYNCKSL